jgi:leader peptidase (prepilin peptidase)/N-methyltransferase
MIGTARRFGGPRRLPVVGYDPAVLPALVAGASAAGACWGLLLPGLINRYAVRWPDGTPQPPWRQCCAHCEAPRARWWTAAGRCTGCGRRPSPGWWVTVPASALIWGAVAAGAGLSPVLPALLWLAALAVPLALIDLSVQRLPDPLVGALFTGGVALLGVAAAIEGATDGLVRGGVAAVVCGAGYLVLALVPGAGLGLGDVKLGAALGLYLGWFGWYTVAAGVFLVPLINLPLLIGLLIAGRVNRKSPMAYGPAMLAAALLAATLGVLM